MGCVALADSACVSILFSPQSPQGVYSTLCMTRGLREEMLVPSERELQFLTTRYLVVGMREQIPPEYIRIGGDINYLLR